MTDSEVVDSGKPLFVVCSRRVYRPSEAPQKARDKACEREHVDLEPSWLSDRLLGSFEDEFAAHGLSRRTSGRDSRGPFWTLDCQGAGVGIALDCDDVPKFVAARKIPHDAGLLARIVDSGNGPTLKTEAAGRDGCRTEPESEYCLDEPAEIKLAQAICDNWADYVRDLARRMFKDLETDRDYLCSWEAVRESLESNGQGIDDNGHRVDLDECRTEGSGYNVGD